MTVLGAFAILVTVAGGSALAGAADDPLGCADRVFDPSGIASSELTTVAEQVATSLSADLHVRIEGSLDGDIAGRESRLEAQCAGWLGADGLRVDNLLVVMVSPSERQTSIYFGSTYQQALVEAGPQIQEFVMNPRFKEGATERGLIDGLNAIVVAVHGGGVPQEQAPIYDPSQFTVPTYHRSNTSSLSSSGSKDGLPSAGLVVFIVLVIIVLIVVQVAKAGGWSETSSSSGYRSRGYSSSRSFSSRSRGSSHSSSHSSSSSHHSGGGGSSSSW